MPSQKHNLTVSCKLSVLYALREVFRGGQLWDSFLYNFLSDYIEEAKEEVVLLQFPDDEDGRKQLAKFQRATFSLMKDVVQLASEVDNFSKSVFIEQEGGGQ
ncbi:MAG: hypothetical protein WC663_03535 [Patescibacteria group bacterium]|jgi:hypothetical protein